MDGRRSGVPGPLQLVVGSGGLRKIIAAAEHPAILGLAASVDGAVESHTSCRRERAFKLLLLWFRLL